MKRARIGDPLFLCNGSHSLLSIFIWTMLLCFVFCSEVVEFPSPDLFSNNFDCFGSWTHKLNVDFLLPPIMFNDLRYSFLLYRRQFFCVLNNYFLCFHLLERSLIYWFTPVWPPRGRRITIIWIFHDCCMTKFTLGLHCYLLVTIVWPLYDHIIPIVWPLYTHFLTFLWTLADQIPILLRGNFRVLTQLVH